MLGETIMKNKEFIRRTTAFIAALSIVYATVITETFTMHWILYCSRFIYMFQGNYK